MPKENCLIDGQLSSIQAGLLGKDYKKMAAIHGLTKLRSFNTLLRNHGYIVLRNICSSISSKHSANLPLTVQYSKAPQESKGLTIFRPPHHFNLLTLLNPN